MTTFIRQRNERDDMTRSRMPELWEMEWVCNQSGTKDGFTAPMANGLWETSGLLWFDWFYGEKSGWLWAVAPVCFSRNCGSLEATAGTYGVTS